MFEVKKKATKTTPVLVAFFNFEHISHLYCSVSIVNFELVNAGWDDTEISS